MHLIRRAAARTLVYQPSRWLSTLQRSSARLSVFQPLQPTVYRAFHQSRLCRIDEKASEPVAQAIADEAVTEELKDEAVQAAEVAEAAAETAVNAGEEAPEVAEEAIEIARGAAEVAEQAAEQAAAAAPGEDGLNVSSDAAAVAGEVAAAAAVTASSAASAAATATGAPASGASQQPNPSNNTLYVGNLFFEVNAAQLQAEFEKFGLVTNSRIVTDPRGLSRGFGYIEFENPDSAERAIRESDQRVFQGRRMAVQMHKRMYNSRRPQGSREANRNPPSKTLFIGNMSYQMSDKDLNDLFRDVRDVLDVRVAIDRRSGQPRGFAHADFVDEQAATRARAELQDKLVYGRSLRVDYAGHSSGSGGGRGRRDRQEEE